MISIRDVAKIAGVSPSTVSRVINQTANVDQEKRERVLAAIAETGFKPNELARALYKKSSKIIGVIVPNIDNPFFSELARAIEEEAFNNGYKILLCNSNNNSEKEIMNIQMLDQLKSDGIILITNSDKTGQEVVKSKVPVIMLDRKQGKIGEIASIAADHYKGGMMATQHLIDCGCKNIVCIKGPQDLTSGLLRYQGHLEACLKNGIQSHSIECKYQYDDGLKAAEQLLSQYPDVDGIVACNDLVAIAVYKILFSKGYRVPDDIQIVGFDDIHFSKLLTPELTTIAQPIQVMGARAVQIIIQYGNGEAIEEEQLFDVQLVQRQTTKGLTT